MNGKNNPQNDPTKDIKDTEPQQPASVSTEELSESIESLAQEEEEINSRIDKLAADLEEKSAELEKEKKEYLFLMAEFDNYRKRTLKEKSELVKSAAEQALKGLLPVVDDFERGLQAAEDSKDVQGVKQGMDLIYQKFLSYLDKNGVKAIDPKAGDDFDTEKHEAVSVIPAPTPEQKGKVIDTVQKGYTVGGKVMRHAKVVVGQ